MKKRQYLGEGKVKTPTGFKAAFDEYAQGGWIGFERRSESWRSRAHAKMVTMLAEEMVFTNQSFALYPNLSGGACMCIYNAGSEEQNKPT